MGTLESESQFNKGEMAYGVKNISFNSALYNGLSRRVFKFIGRHK